MKKVIKEIFPYLVVLIIVFFIKSFIISPIRVNGESMHSTLYNNDIMILNKIGYKLNGVKRFDIVVINYKGSYLIKRIIGLPGDKIEIIDNKLFINGIYTEEKFLDSSVVTFDFSLNEKIPDGYYFVMGDNRVDSLDSRVLGLFSEDDIEGIADLILFPFSRFGFKK